MILIFLSIFLSVPSWKWKMKNELYCVYHFLCKWKTNEIIKHPRSKFVKHQNSSQLFEFRFSYWGRNKNFEFRSLLYQKYEMTLWVHGLFISLFITLSTGYFSPHQKFVKTYKINLFLINIWTGSQTALSLFLGNLGEQICH